MTVKVYQVDGYEIHMTGTLVGVAYPTEVRSVSITGDDGFTYSRPVTVRKVDRFARPFIGFFAIRKNPADGRYYRDEDSPIADGVDPDIARLVAKELIEAADYFDFYEGDHEPRA